MVIGGEDKSFEVETGVEEREEGENGNLVWAAVGVRGEAADVTDEDGDVGILVE